MFSWSKSLEERLHLLKALLHISTSDPWVGVQSAGANLAGLRRNPSTTFLSPSSVGEGLSETGTRAIKPSATRFTFCHFPRGVLHSVSIRKFLIPIPEDFSRQLQECPRSLVIFAIRFCTRIPPTPLEVLVDEAYPRSPLTVAWVLKLGLWHHDPLLHLLRSFGGAQDSHRVCKGLFRAAGTEDLEGLCAFYLSTLVVLSLSLHLLAVEL